MLVHSDQPVTLRSNSSREWYLDFWNLEEENRKPLVFQLGALFVPMVGEWGDSFYLVICTSRDRWV